MTPRHFLDTHPPTNANPARPALVRAALREYVAIAAIDRQQQQDARATRARMIAARTRLARLNANTQTRLDAPGVN